MYFHNTVNNMPWKPLAMIRVCSPRMNKPCTPSLATIILTASGYVMGVVDVCFVVFTTRIEFEEQSETNDEQKPIKAFLYG